MQLINCVTHVGEMSDTMELMKQSDMQQPWHETKACSRVLKKVYQHRSWRRSTVTHGPLWSITGALRLLEHTACLNELQKKYYSTYEEKKNKDITAHKFVTDQTIKTKSNRRQVWRNVIHKYNLHNTDDNGQAVGEELGICSWISDTWT